MNTMNKYPRFGGAVGLLLILVAVQIILTIPLSIIAGYTDPNLATNPWIMLGITLLGAAIVVWFAHQYSSLPYTELCYLRSFRWKILLPIAVATLGMVVVVGEMGKAFEMWYPMPEWLKGLFEQLLGSQTGIAGPIMAIVIAPLTEEFIFRGVILRGFLANYNPKKAIFLSALLFAIIHLNPWQAIGALLIGLFLGWVVYKTRSIWPAVFIHALVNSTSYWFGVFGDKYPFQTLENMDATAFLPWWIVLISLALVVGGIYYTRQLFNTKS